MKSVTTITFVFCGLVAACSSVPESPSAGSLAASSNAPASRTGATDLTAAEIEARRMSQTIKSLQGRSVYFDYDSFSIKPEHQAAVDQDASALKSSRNVSVRLEGNADERGSREYNLALGQKRAEAVKRSLSILGVPEDQLDTVSYGKEKPRSECHEEKCWSENRRVDFAVKTLDKSTAKQQR